jgi:hypothetical protein
MSYPRVDVMKSSEAAKGRQHPQQEADEFYRCPDCMSECPEDVSPRDYSHVEAGFSQRGFQVWCLRHERNVIHITFNEQFVNADTGMYGKFGGRNFEPMTKEVDQ